MALSKEKMQILILSAILVLGTLFVDIRFLVAPMIAEGKKAVAETLALRAELDEARAVVRGRPEIMAGLEEGRQRLAKLKRYLPLPVLGNYLLGITEQVRQWAEEASLDIINVVDDGIVALETSEKICQVYSVRVTAEGNLKALIGFLSELEAANPMVTVSTLSISTRPEQPNRHDIRLVLDWLIWRDPDNLPEYVYATAESDF